MKKNNPLTRQAGYTATAMIAMLAVGGIVTAGAARHTLATTSESQGTVYGTALANANRAVGTYTVLHYKALIEGSAIAGVADPLRPTVQELSALGLPNAQLNPIAPMGGGYSIEISREPAGCVAPNCNLTSRTWFTRPITNPSSGNIDIEKLGAAAQAIGGDGGWSDPESPATVRGTGGWSRANPAGNTAGILMAINGYGSSVFANYVDRQGVQGMLADLKLGGNNINGINAVNATTVNGASVNATTVTGTSINAQNMTLAGGRTLNIGGSQMYGDGTTTAIYQSGALYIEHHDYSPADIGKVGSVNSQGTIATNRLESRGDIVAAGTTHSAGISANEVFASGWLRTRGGGGWYSEAFGGGLHMTDSDWIRSYNNKSMYTAGQMQAGSLQSNGTLSVAGSSSVGSQTVHNSQVVGGDHTVYGSTRVSNAIVPGAIAWEGGYCGHIAGAIGRDGNNNLFICN